MIAICKGCLHYRGPRPASQLLAAAVDVGDGAVANTLAKIVEDEQKWLESEATIKRGRANTTDDDWGRRPVMSPFCAAHEGEGRWLIPEIHNRAGDCPEHSADAAQRHACSDCAWRRTATGAARDTRREQTYIDMLDDDTVTQAKTSSSDESLLTKHREAVAAREALEIHGAYAAQGVLLREPLYLDWCSTLSKPDEGEYYVCVLANPHARCPLWQATAAGSQQTGSQVPRVPTVNFTPARTQGDVIPAPGGAGGLTPAEADEVIAMMLWLLEIELPVDYVAHARDLLADLWAADDQTRTFVTDVCHPQYQQWRALHEALADSFREQAQPGLVAALRSGGSEFAALLLDQYDRVNAAMAPGEPPLTREIADAFVDVLAFVEAVAQGVEPGPPDPRDRDGWVTQMARAWPGLQPEVRGWLATMPIGWAKLRYEWATLAPERRAWYQQLLQSQLGMIDGVAQQVAMTGAPPAETPGGLAPFAPVASIRPPDWSTQQPQTPPRLPTMPAWATADLDQGPSQDQLLDRIVAKQEKEEADAAEQDPELALQIRMHNQMERSALISNMMSMEHQTMMSIIGNIRA